MVQFYPTEGVKLHHRYNNSLSVMRQLNCIR